MITQAEIGIDLGTANSLIYSKSKGIALNEPSVAAIDAETKNVIAIGNEAKEMIGKTPENVIAIRPLKNGVIADFDLTSAMLTQLMKKAVKNGGFSFRKPNVVVCTPSGSTSAERRAIIETVRNAGAKKVHMIEESVAAAIGAGMPVDEPVANVVLDLGGGTCEAAIISFGGVVACHSIRMGGDHLDENIIQYVKKQYNILIGERTAEKIKMEIGYALIDHDRLEMDVRGRDLVTGLPNTVKLHSYEIRDCLKDSLLQMLDTLKKTLEDCPAELSGDIVDRGVTLTGGSSLLNGMEEWLSKEIFVPVQLAQNPLEAVATGTGEALKFIDRLMPAAK